MRRPIAVLTAVFLLSSVLASPVGASEWIGGDVFKGAGEGVVALTFDDGPDEKKTDEILCILEKYGIKATFFMIGENAELYPDVARRVIESGHEVGNHTFSHGKLSGMDEKSVKDEIDHAADVIFSALESGPHFLRPPGGNFDERVISVAREEDLVIAMWTVDTLDWNHRSTDYIVREVLDNVHGGDIILMHDYVSGEAHTADALEIIIPALMERGYRFVTLSDMYLNYR